jgi:hypothetical protein
MVYNYQQASKASLDNVLSLFGGIEKLDIDKSSVKEIVDSDMWQTVWDDNFNGSNKLHVCARVCGKFPEQVVSQCRDQFLDLDNFNE